MHGLDLRVSEPRQQKSDGGQAEAFTGAERLLHVAR